MVERQLPKLHTRVRFPSPAFILVINDLKQFLVFEGLKFKQKFKRFQIAPNQTKMLQHHLALEEERPKIAARGLRGF